ncbi:MAG: host attachment protein [Phycisphaerae bacterium]|jgi:protein required for attachment to host cells
MNRERMNKWIVTVDCRHARVFGWERTPGGALRLEPLRWIDNPHEAEHERGRPNLLGVAAVGAPGRGVPQGASEGHAAEEEERRFARDLAGRGGWLCRAIHELKADRVTVFAPAKFLGMLREEMDANTGRGDGPLPECVSFEAGELTHLRPGELAVHPRVMNAVESSACRR